MQQQIPMDTTRRLAHYIANVQYDDIPPEHYEALKKNIVDITGALVSGYNADGIEQIFGLIEEWGGKEESRIIFRNKSCVGHWAAFINSAMGRGVDCEDNEENGAHPTASMWPTVLACADKLGGISGKEMLLGYALGRDIGARVNFSNLDYHGFEPVNTAGVFATTAIACRLFGLTEEQTVSALGHAMNFAGGSFQSNIDGVLGVRVNQGMASFSGMLAAELAQAGVTGPYNAFEGVYGYYHLFANDQVAPNVLLDGLGEKFLGQCVNFKHWPSCAQTAAATDIALEYVSEGIEPDDVDHVDIRLSPSGFNLVGKPFKLGKTPSVETQYSVRYCFSNVLTRKVPKLEQYTSAEGASDPRVIGFLDKISVSPDPSFNEMPVEVADDDPTAHIVRTRGRYYRCEIDLYTKDGTKHPKVVDYWKGHSRNPLSMDDIIEKYWDNIAYGAGILSKQAAAEELEMILHLETLDTSDKLIALLA